MRPADLDFGMDCAGVLVLLLLPCLLWIDALPLQLLVGAVGGRQLSERRTELTNHIMASVRIPIETCHLATKTSTTFNSSLLSDIRSFVDGNVKQQTSRGISGI